MCRCDLFHYSWSLSPQLNNQTCFSFFFFFFDGAEWFKSQDELSFFGKFNRVPPLSLPPHTALITLLRNERLTTPTLFTRIA